LAPICGGAEHTAASVIETKRKALETEELDRRVAILEQQLAKGK